MILEGLVTTINSDGSVNLAPMGPLISGPQFDELMLRPYRTSTTYQNLKRWPAGVFHITDDVELLARAAIGRWERDPDVRSVASIDGFVIADACRWYAFTAEGLDDREQRTTIRCRVVESGRSRDFLGFNRAKHAVLELAILATRVHLLPSVDVFRQLEHYRAIVDKTAGAQESRAFALLESFLREAYAVVEQPGSD